MHLIRKSQLSSNALLAPVGPKNPPLDMICLLNLRWVRAATIHFFFQDTIHILMKAPRYDTTLCVFVHRHTRLCQLTANAHICPAILKNTWSEVCTEATRSKDGTFLFLCLTNRYTRAWTWVRKHKRQLFLNVDEKYWNIDIRKDIAVHRCIVAALPEYGFFHIFGKKPSKSWNQESIEIYILPKKRERCNLSSKIAYHACIRPRRLCVPRFRHV